MENLEIQKKISSLEDVDKEIEEAAAEEKEEKQEQKETKAVIQIL